MKRERERREEKGRKEGREKVRVRCMAGNDRGAKAQHQRRASAIEQSNIARPLLLLAAAECCRLGFRPPISLPPPSIPQLVARFLGSNGPLACPTVSRCVTFNGLVYESPHRSGSHPSSPPFYYHPGLNQRQRHFTAYGRVLFRLCP